MLAVPPVRRPAFPGGVWLLTQAFTAPRGPNVSGHTNAEKGPAMTEPRSGVKTLGIKLPDALHAQFTLVAQLDGISLGDAVLRAVELYVSTKRQEPDFAARASAALEEIEREAAARRGAIEGLLGTSPDQPETSPKPTSRSRKTATDE
ncbi:MAG: hypothetical protein JWQ81_677 [Amycolatopsis sp.]|nr:hypothetical protein [Amycolatopsis sp.]